MQKDFGLIFRSLVMIRAHARYDMMWTSSGALLGSDQDMNWAFLIKSCNPAGLAQVSKHPNMMPKVVKESARGDWVSGPRVPKESLTVQTLFRTGGKQPKTVFRTVQRTFLGISPQRPENAFLRKGKGT